MCRSNLRASELRTLRPNSESAGMFSTKRSLDLFFNFVPICISVSEDFATSSESSIVPLKLVSRDAIILIKQSMIVFTQPASSFPDTSIGLSRQVISTYTIATLCEIGVSSSLSRIMNSMSSTSFTRLKYGKLCGLVFPSELIFSSMPFFGNSIVGNSSPIFPTSSPYSLNAHSQSVSLGTQFSFEEFDVADKLSFLPVRDRLRFALGVPPTFDDSL
mmetsp:Transcript_10602/g.19358  ORF Transcript_10602/g.19358 Transcript_10602/m.19358 type:complete len:217 (-) Transcript_10602:528-1178(-)